MRSVSVRASGIALLLLLVLTSTVPAFAGRIHIVPGSPAEEESAEAVLLPPGGGAGEEESLQGRIQPPVGITAEEEPPSVWELFLVWLQHRILPPVG